MLSSLMPSQPPTLPTSLPPTLLPTLLQLLDQTLSLHGRGLAFTAETPLLGALPELDSMAVVALITSLEETFCITVEDDAIDGRTFATVGSLAAFVGEQMRGSGRY